MTSFLQLRHDLQLYRKRAHHSHVPVTFKTIFQNNVMCQETGKGTEETEVFARICFRKR